MVARRAAQERQIALPAGGVVERGQKLKITPVMPEENVAQIDQAVGRLLERHQLSSRGTFPVFHLAVVLEKGDIVGSCLDVLHPLELIVERDRTRPEAVFDADTHDAGRETRTNLGLYTRTEFITEKDRDLVGFDAKHRLAGELLVERRQRLGGAKYQIRRVFHLHQAPPVARPKLIEHGAESIGVAIQNLMQRIGREWLCRLRVWT